MRGRLLSEQNADPDEAFPADHSDLDRAPIFESDHERHNRTLWKISEFDALSASLQHPLQRQLDRLEMRNQPIQLFGRESAQKLVGMVRDEWL